MLVLSLLAGLAALLCAADRAPLVLLDDLDAELDRERLALATGLFSGAPQTVATSSRPEAFAGLREGARWGLAKGVISGLPQAFGERQPALTYLFSALWRLFDEAAM